MKLARAAHLISVRALVIVIAAVAGIAGLLITAGSGASAQTGSAHARSAPGGAALTAQRACPLNPSPPAGFIERKVQVNGIGINYVRGGHGPTLLLLHGYPETWYVWRDVLPALARHYTVVAPDLPGAGLSDAPAAAADYTKKAMAADIYGLMVKLGLSRDIRVVGHDIGTEVAYSYAAAHPHDVAKLVLSEAPIPWTVAMAPWARLYRPVPRMMSAITRGVSAPKMPAPTPSSTWTPISQRLSSENV